MIDCTASNRISETLRTVLPLGTVRVTLAARTWLTSSKSEVVAVLARGGHVDL